MKHGPKWSKIRIEMTVMDWNAKIAEIGPRNFQGGIPFRPRPTLEHSSRNWPEWNKIDNSAHNLKVPIVSTLHFATSSCWLWYLNTSTSLAYPCRIDTTLLSIPNNTPILLGKNKHILHIKSTILYSSLIFLLLNIRNLSEEHKQWWFY